jgi:hypothetical protein
VLRDPALRVKVALWLLVISTVAWPASQLTVARSEPPFVLGLSWFAIILTALDIVITTDVRQEQDGDTDEIKRCANCGYEG